MSIDINKSIDLMAGSIPKLQQLIDKLYNCSAAYGMDVSLYKSKIMVLNYKTAIKTL